MRLPAASAALALATVLVPAVIATQSAQAQTFTTLHSFDGNDGRDPESAGLIQATDGNLYGTTPGGGSNLTGTAFKITPSGTLTTIYNFCPEVGPCGAGPYAGLVQATNGNFYGTTLGGGTNSNNGTVFEITPSGTLTTLYSFCSQNQGGICTDGQYPYAGLVQGTDGNFYGTTIYGGVNSCPGLPGCGTVFKITSGGALTTLHSFDGTDGFNPYAGLVQATNGNFYGTVYAGGATGHGTVFKITPSGTLTTLYNFCSPTNGCTDGEYPYAALVQATNGNFYGTTTVSGAAGDQGTVFEITPSGTLTTIYNFCTQTGCPDGASPDSALVQATDGNFYGTTFGGGANACPGGGGCGTVFKITPSGALTTLYIFCTQNGCPDGTNPEAALVQDTNGDFYGTTFSGGANGLGTVFSLSLGFRRFVETQPTSGKVGAAVKILGTNLTGSTSVTFNGTPAAFGVVSATEITTTVPAGATTGKVQVTTPSATLTSNVNFRVP
jgi:uncharacterized repeat protein (TIGR03803 family)